MTDKIREQIQAIRARHAKGEPLQGAWLCDANDCAADWPCDAIRLAEKLELAVKALEAEHRAAGLRNATKARRIIGEALAAIADLGEKEGETR